MNVIHAHWAINRGGEFPTTKVDYMKNIIARNSPPQKVITLVREPIERNKSAFFQQLHKYYPDYRSATAQDLHNTFVKQYIHNWGDLWFEQELMTVFNIDPFSEPFDYKNGYKIYKDGKHRILIIRLEDTDKLDKALYKLLGIRGINMLSKNILEERHKGTFRGNLYKEFKQISLPDYLLDEYKNLKYVKSFYKNWRKE